MDELQMVVFRCGREYYAVPISQVKEIIHYKEATKLPHAPSWMEGVINLRGRVIPVASLARRFGFAAAAEDDLRAVITEIGGTEVGIVVDEVSEVIRVPKGNIEPPPVNAVAEKYIQGIGKVDERLLILLDLDSLLTAADMQPLN